MTDMPILNIDLDNTLGDFSASMQAFGEMKLGRELPISKSWNIHGDWGIPKGLWAKLFREGVRDGVIWGPDEPMIPGALEGMWELSDAGYWIRIITHRLAHTNDYDLAAKQTIEWLRLHGFPYRSIAVIGAEPKSNYLARALVDDGAHNIKAWLEAGLQNAIVFDQPWNHDLGDAYIRARGWKEVVPLIRELVPV